MSSYPAETLAYGNAKNKLRARVDISRAVQVDDVNLEDEVTIVIKGKVRRLDGPEQFMATEYKNGKEKEVKRRMPGCIELEISSMVVRTDGAFEGMLERAED